MQEHKHRDLWVGLAVGLPAIGAGSALTIWATEAGKRHVGFWPHAGEIAGLVLIALGGFLAVAVVRGWRLPGGFRQDGEKTPNEAPVTAATPATVNPDEFKPYHDESGEFPDSKALTLGFAHINDHPGAYMAFRPIRCMVTAPSGVITSATGLGRYYEYPQQFKNAPPVRPGLYRFTFEGQLMNGEWAYITGGEREVKAPPSLIVTILEDSQFENWKYIALIAALHVQVTNTTDMPIAVQGNAFTTPGTDGDPPWDAQATGDEITSIRREIARRDETQQYGQLLRNFNRIGPRQTISGWFLTPVTRKPQGGTPTCTVIVTDGAGNEYRATLPTRPKQVHGS